MSKCMLNVHFINKYYYYYIIIIIIIIIVNLSLWAKEMVQFEVWLLHGHKQFFTSAISSGMEGLKDAHSQCLLIHDWRFLRHFHGFLLYWLNQVFLLFL